MFASEECAQEESASKMAHLRVVPVLVNRVIEEEALLDSGSQIISMTRDVAAANKISWDPGLSIQLQSANGSLSRTCGLAKNVPFTLGDDIVLLQAHIMYHKWSLTICDGCFDTSKSSKMRSKTSDKRCC